MLGSSAAPTGSYTLAKRKRPTFPDATPGDLRNEHRNSILMTRHYSNVGGASDWLNQIFNQSEALPRSS